MKDENFDVHVQVLLRKLQDMYKCCDNPNLRFTNKIYEVVIGCAHCGTEEIVDDIHELMSVWRKRFGVKELECQELLSRE